MPAEIHFNGDRIPDIIGTWLVQSETEPDYDDIEAYGDWPPLTPDEMLGIADYLLSIKTEQNHERIDLAVDWWVLKAEKADDVLQDQNRLTGNPDSI